MKRYTFFMLFIAVMGCFYQSCQKDNFGVKPSDGGAFGINSSQYDSFGEQLEHAISQAIANQDFKEILIDRVNEMPLGDTEVLLSSFLSQTVEGSSETTMDILLDYAKEEFAKEDLERFLASFPSVVIASRGPSWNRAKRADLPPVVFLNSSFDEKMTSLEGSQEGEKVQVDASQAFKSTVIAIHLSERHDRDGTPYYLTEAGDPNRLALQTKETPIIDLGGFDDAVKISCVEPTSCSTVSIDNFDVVEQNGALFISYSVDIPDDVCSSWVKIKILRTNPDGTITTTIKNGSDLPIFYDTNITPGVQYSYNMVAYVHYLKGLIGLGGWVLCDADTAGPINVNAPSIGGPVEFYNGENMSNTHLLYTWQPPSAGATQYQLRRWVDDHWEEVALLPGTQTYYEYNYPASDRNRSVIMSVRYKGSGPWSESIFDETKGSFRNPGSDLYFHGVHFPDAADFEQNGGESPFLGYPEFRVLASKGNTPNSVTIIQEKVVPTGRCWSTETWEEWIYDPYDYAPGSHGDELIIHQERSDYYYPKDGSVPIIQGWDSDLYGQYITIEVSETDIMEITATGEQLTEANSKSLSAKIGLKILGFGFGLGYSQTTQTKQTTKILYPNSDQNVGFKIYTYNEPMEQVADGLIFGPEYILGGDMCCYFSERVDNIVLCND